MELNIKDVLTQLDKTHYKAWAKESAPRGYVSGDIPVDILVELIETYRTALSQPQEEPVAIMTIEFGEIRSMWLVGDDKYPVDGTIELFTAPPAQPNTSSKEAALLANAIVQAAIKRGIVNADVGDLTGPMVMHLVDCLADLSQPVSPVPLSDKQLDDILTALEPMCEAKGQSWEFAKAMLVKILATQESK